MPRYKLQRSLAAEVPDRRCQAMIASPRSLAGDYLASVTSFYLRLGHWLFASMGHLSFRFSSESSAAKTNLGTARFDAQYVG
jgi:hypothetical protein